MGRNKKDAAQDVLNLYNQMQEEETVEAGKEEISSTIAEIESAKAALDAAREELAKTTQIMTSTNNKLTATHKSVALIIEGIYNAVILAGNTTLKVGINDNGFAQLNERNNKAITAFKQALDEHEKRINALFARQQKELKRLRNIEDGAYFNGKTYWWMFGIAFVSWAIIIAEITVWICLRLGM